MTLSFGIMNLKIHGMFHRDDYLNFFSSILNDNDIHTDKTLIY